MSDTIYIYIVIQKTDSLFKYYEKWANLNYRGT